MFFILIRTHRIVNRKVNVEYIIGKSKRYAEIDIFHMENE